MERLAGLRHISCFAGGPPDVRPADPADHPAVETLGGSARGREITTQVLTDIGATDEQIALTYGTRAKSVLVDRADWARSYATLGGALERPQRGLFVLTALGKEILALPAEEAAERVQELDQQVRARPRPERRVKRSPREPEETEAAIAAEAIEEVEQDEDERGCRETLLARLHRLSPDGFEEFAVYLLKTFGMELTRVGGSGDEGIDAIGLVPSVPCSHRAWPCRRSSTTLQRRSVGRLLLCSNETQLLPAPSAQC